MDRLIRQLAEPVLMNALRRRLAITGVFQMLASITMIALAVLIVNQFFYRMVLVIGAQVVFVMAVYSFTHAVRAKEP